MRRSSLWAYPASRPMRSLDRQNTRVFLRHIHHTIYIAPWKVVYFGRGFSGGIRTRGASHLSANTSLRVSLFLFEISSAAAHTSFSCCNLARMRAAGSASSGSSTMHVMTYFRKTSVRAICACPRVRRPCTCFARFVSVAASQPQNALSLPCHRPAEVRAHKLR